MNKKGFTLVELLAVIAILAILVIIALPNVMGMFNEAKKNSFTTELKEVYKVAQQTWITDSMMNTNVQEYSRCKTCVGKSLSLSGRQELDYFIKLDKSGRVVEYYATDGTYQFQYDGPGLLVETINGVNQVSNLEDSQIITISNSKPSIGGNETIETKKFNIERYSIQYEPGMKWSEWINSSYNESIHFTIDNRTQLSEYNGDTSYSYLPDNAYGISTGKERTKCFENHFLTSFKPLYNATINRYVYSSDEISDSYNYLIYGSSC